MFLILPFLFGFTFAYDVLDTSRGYILDDQTSDFYVIVGTATVEVNLEIEAETLKLDIRNYLNNSSVNRACVDTAEISELVDQANGEIDAYLQNKITELELSNVVKIREDRAIGAFALAVATPVVAGVSGSLVDRLFNNGLKKDVNGLKLEITDINKKFNIQSEQLRTTSIEVCLLSSSMLQTKIRNYVDSYKLQIDARIRQYLFSIFSGQLEFDTKIKACISVNSELDTAVCTRLARLHDFKPFITEIFRTANGGTIVSEVLVPIIGSKYNGYKIKNFGIPSVQDGIRTLNYPVVPNYVLENITYSGDFRGAFVDAESLVVDDRSSFNCLAVEGPCDTISRRATYDFRVLELFRHQIVSTFTNCYFSYTNKDNVRSEQVITPGVAPLKHHHGELHCGRNSVKIQPSSVVSKVEVAKPSSVKNHISGINFEKTSIFDPDHDFNKAVIYEHLRLGQILIPLAIVLSLITLTVVIKISLSARSTYKRALGTTRIV